MKNREKIYNILSLTYAPNVRFKTKDVYDLTFPILSRTNPFNTELKGTVRRELQILRDLNYLRFHKPGEYSLS